MAWLSGTSLIRYLRVREFGRSEQGNIAVIFALALLPVLSAIGCAVDYSQASRLRTQLGSMADSAVLTTVNKQAMGASASTVQASALSMFNGLAGTLTNYTLTSSNVTVTDAGTGRTGVLSYTATMPTTFMNIVGKPTMTIGGSTTAESALPTYIDFYLLLDNTPSMGIGATPTDVATMVSHTPDQCAFACHDLNDNNNYYKLAKTLGVTTRIDVVRTATQQLMDTATSLTSVPNQFRMAIYTFGASAASAGLTTITALTSSLSTAKTNAANIDLMTVNGQGQFDDTDTDYDRIFPAINGAITTPGDGSTAAQPQKIMFFVSDGVADEFNAGGCTQPTLNGDGRCQEPITVSLCKTIKDRGIKIAVLYTTYLALTTNSWYNNTIAPFNAGPYGPSPNSLIARNMKSCASDGLYFEVSPTQGISDAMNALFRKAVNSARLTR
jgi:Flp pilus assembly protein TadG